MIKERKFLYKAQRTDNGEWVEGRVGHSRTIDDGVETTTYFYEYVGDKMTNGDWSTCVVNTDSIISIN